MTPLMLSRKTHAKVLFKEILNATPSVSRRYSVCWHVVFWTVSAAFVIVLAAVTGGI